jgi:hypothetical protein
MDEALSEQRGSCKGLPYNLTRSRPPLIDLYIPLLSLPTVAAVTIHSIIVCTKAVEAGYVRKQLMCIAVWEA